MAEQNRVTRAEFNNMEIDLSNVNLRMFHIAYPLGAAIALNCEGAAALLSFHLNYHYDIIYLSVNTICACR